MDENIYQLTNLVSVNISNNYRITDSGFKNLTNLTSLYLKGTKISDNYLTNLINLKTLMIGKNNCYITDNGLKKLASYNNLIELFIRNNNITNGGIKEFYNLKKLNIKLNFNIDDDGIKNLTNLTELGINRLVSKEGIKNLKLLTNIY